MSVGLEPYYMIETHICDPLGDGVWDYPDIYRREGLLLVLVDPSISRVIGIALFLHYHRMLILDAFCVYNEYRGKGVASYFLNEAIRMAAEKYNIDMDGEERVYLIASTFGNKLYRSYGFRPITSDDISNLTKDERQKVYDMQIIRDRVEDSFVSVLVADVGQFKN